MYETETRVRQWNERQKEQSAAGTPIVEQSTERYFHEDGRFHAEPHAPVWAENTEPVSAPIPSGMAHDWASMSPEEHVTVSEAIEKRHLAESAGYHYKRNPDGKLLLDERVF